MGWVNWIKRFISNILVTTSLPLIVLSVFVRLQGFDLHLSRTVLLTFGANVVIHMGHQITQRLGSKYLVLNVFFGVAFTITVLIAFGFVFDLFDVTPIPVLVLLAVLAHIFALFLNLEARKCHEKEYANEKEKPKPRRGKF